MGFFKKVVELFTGNELKEAEALADKVMALDGEMTGLSEAELRGKTEEFKNRVKNGETLDDILVEAFAVCREASYRVLGMKHFRVQIIGGVILHQGKIAEMKTGEGKTLVATLPAYLNALSGKGVHVVTVNDYLAKRDKTWMSKLYNYLGLSVGCILNGMDNTERREAYNSDITYGTNNEFGFDYLRDNMVIYKSEMVQREKNYAIVDEVDSILIDEARTPLIISGRGEKSTDLYSIADRFVKGLKGRVLDPNETKSDPFDREIKEETVDFVIDEKGRSCNLTEKGNKRAEDYFNIENLADMENMELAHHINQALKANYVMKRDIDYVVQDGKVLIVDEFTGRIMDGRRYSEGLHQAIEAKESIEIRSESKTLATITFQNYFRMYDKLSGMTGTAKTEEPEFREIYGMDVVEIPTNRPILREDLADSIYATEPIKYRAIVNEVRERHASGQPVLVGTISIENSELLSKLLKREGIPHEVLNAKQHMREAEIVAQAGRLGAVTIATNMAGRGTDIVLGGNPEFLAKKGLAKKYSQEVIDLVDSFEEISDEEVLEAKRDYKELYEKHKKDTDANASRVKAAGGLCIIGTERHESRRIDNQLRGRAGRQGDPGSSKFFLSLEDDLMRLFGGERIKRLMESADMDENEPLEHRMLTNSIEGAQRRVEGNNFAIRKHVLQYDDVMNKQREVIYAERKRVLEGENLKPYVEKMIASLADYAVDVYIGDEKLPDNWDLNSLSNYLINLSLIDQEIPFEAVKSCDREMLKNGILKMGLKKYHDKEEEIGQELIREIERIVLLQVVDSKWMDHIDAMDQLRQGIGLRAYGQVDPVQAYQHEGFDMFEEMNQSIKEDTIKYLLNVAKPEDMERKRVAEETEASGGDVVKSKEPIVKGEKIGRNDPCPCGSGKKYKKCCGQDD